MEKKRCTNFTKDEVEVLVNLVEDDKETVECKKTDSASNSTKEAGWRSIEEKFNAICGTGRTAKMLRSKWDSLKKTVKKEYGECKQSLYKTGGGPPTEIKLNGVGNRSVGNRVLAIVGVGVTGTVSRYDSDFVAEIPAAIECAETQNSFVENVEITEMPSCTWNSWNPHQLRQPKNKVLLEFENSSISDNEAAANVKSILTVQSEAGPMVNDDKCHTPNSLNMKRKRFYKAESTATKLQKKRSCTSTYEQLAHKKIEYIEFQIALLKKEAEKKEERLAEKHKLETVELELKIKKQQLEISSLELELRKKQNS